MTQNDSKDERQFWEELLPGLLEEGAGIEGAIVLTGDGLPLASKFANPIGKDGLKVITAQLAACLSLASNITFQAGRGGLDQAYIKGNAGYVMIKAMQQHNRVLACICGEQTKLGLVFLDMGRFGRES